VFVVDYSTGGGSGTRRETSVDEMRLLSLYRKGREVLERYDLLEFYLRVRRIFPNPIGSYLRSRAIDVYGHKMFVDAQDASGLFRTGVYEPAETQLIEREIQRGDVVVDIGANIGYHTLIFARLVGDTGRVYAFEPDPANFALLKRNVELNAYGNVTLVQKAVSHASERAKLYLHEWNSMHSIAEFEGDHGSVEVEAVRLDDYFQGEGSVDFVKMDLEGGEGRAIQGMLSTLRKNEGIRVLTEFYPFGLKRFGMEREDFLKSLLTLGFDVFCIDEQGRPYAADIGGLLERYTPQDEWAHPNLFCVRRVNPEIKDR
jgi:FkbM family methyltransferase